MCHPGLDPGSRYHIALYTPGFGVEPGMTKIENHTQL